MINQVSGDSIFKRIEKLQNMERYSEEDVTECLSYIQNNIINYMAFTPNFHYFFPREAPNIIAIKTGSVYPDSVVVIGAHYDTYKAGAPGANDNASGVAGVLELMRIMSAYEFEKSIAFVFFSFEEFGMIGSTQLLNNPYYASLQYRAMINFDMIAHHDPEDTLDITVVCPDTNNYDYIVNIASMYTPGIKLKKMSGPLYSDIYSFNGKGIESYWFREETRYGPLPQYADTFLHTDADTLGLSANSPEMARQIVSLSVAVLSDLAGLGTYSNSNIEQESEELYVFPNPVSTYINLNVDKESIFTIFTSKGEVVLRTTSNKTPIDISYLTPGIYFYQILQNDGVIATGKIVISK